MWKGRRIDGGASRQQSPCQHLARLRHGHALLTAGLAATVTLVGAPGSGFYPGALDHVHAFRASIFAMVAIPAICVLLSTALGPPHRRLHPGA
ncbi:hypothetical protein GR157_31595 [Burkholderia sp. 4701]|nr:hypothetical protein [Burkholderia sp. 4701]MXN84775.1 hypothetical protein [Burkholderia sp. 4812]